MCRACATNFSMKTPSLRRSRLIAGRDNFSATSSMEWTRRIPRPPPPAAFSSAADPGRRFNRCFRALDDRPWSHRYLMFFCKLLGADLVAKSRHDLRPRRQERDSCILEGSQKSPSSDAKPQPSQAASHSVRFSPSMTASSRDSRRLPE